MSNFKIISISKAEESRIKGCAGDQSTNCNDAAYEWCAASCYENGVWTAAGHSMWLSKVGWVSFTPTKPPSIL